MKVKTKNVFFNISNTDICFFSLAVEDTAVLGSKRNLTVRNYHILKATSIAIDLNAASLYIISRCFTNNN